jgi:uncharacterized protein YyaL (SSP411 family)
MRRLILVLAMLGIVAATPAVAADGTLRWRAFSDEVFEQAGREQRYVLLHMAAVWCHWCHVMESTTYRDPAVLKLIEGKFIAVRVDQDSRPDLSYRYERWGWPATIMLDKDGNEIFRRRGYQPPELFAKLLQAVIDDPSALPAAEIEPAVDPTLTRFSAERRAAMERDYLASYDKTNGGFGDTHRFLHLETVEYALARVSEGEPWRDMARRTLDGARGLIDPVDGGMFQYSDTLDWTSPHYEKLMNIQLAALRLYTLAYGKWREQKDLAAAGDIARWLRNTMRGGDGAFFASQDADVNATVHGKDYYGQPAAQRQKLGQPRLDRSLYARENGWAIAALAAHYDVSGDKDSLFAAQNAARWLLLNRKAPNGAYGHARASNNDAYLADTLAAGEAFLALHRSTGGRDWLEHAVDAGRAIANRFADEKGGFVAQWPVPGARGVMAKPVKQADENVAATRFLNMLYRYSGEVMLSEASKTGLAYLVALGNEGMILPGALLAERELAAEPVHLTVVGAKGATDAATLYAMARAHPDRYLRIEWWDRREGKLPNNEIEYPELDRAAAFACSQNFCSLPAFDAAEIADRIQAVSRRP